MPNLQLTRSTAVVTLLALGLASLLGATSLRAQMAVKGKLLLEEKFQRYERYAKDAQPAVGGWSVRANHAEWKRSPDGLASGWQTGHMPVLTYEGSFGDAVIEVDFKFHAEPGKWAACRISATNPKLNPRAYAASVWARVSLDNSGRPLGMVLEHDEWKPGVITQVDTRPAAFESDKWYTLRMELIGDRVLATCNGVSVYGTHEKFGIQPKTSISLGVGTCPHELRNFRVYAATPNSAWRPPAKTP
jgi:hypothetical protein